MAAPVDGFPQDLSPDAYTVERELGRGAMATVYAVRDTKHGRRVALKVLRPELAASLGAERFRREITLAASLQHPHIVSVYDSGETPSGALWFTMPLIEGESLRDRLRPRGYCGKVVILVDANSQSQSEYAAMAFRAAATVILAVHSGLLERPALEHELVRRRAAVK